MTVKDSYPIQRMDEYIDSLGAVKVFTILDAYSGYWKVSVKEKDRDQTSFVCDVGTLRYLRMPIGLTNAPATFKRALDLILTKFKWQTYLVYIYDIIIYSNTVKEHIRHVDEIRHN